MKKRNYITCPEQRRYEAKVLRLRKVLRDALVVAEKIGDPELVQVTKNMREVGCTGPISFHAGPDYRSGFWRLREIRAEMDENALYYQDLLILENKISRL